MKIKHYILLLCTLPLLLIGCEYGRDDVFNELPDITIQHMAETGIVPEQIFLGDTLRITPHVVYGNEGNNAFDFAWYRQDYSSLKLLSRDSIFNYKMDSLGNWTIRLEVTNKKTQVSNSSTAYTTVISRSERGWYVLKENSEGNTELDLIGINTDGENYFNEQNLLAQWNTELKGAPVTLLYTYNFGWTAPGDSYPTTYLSTLFPVSEEDVLAFRINNEQILSQGNDLFFDRNDHTPHHFEGGITSPLQMILVDRKQSHLYQLGTPSFLPPAGESYQLSPYFTTTEGSNSYQLGFEETTHSFVYYTQLAAEPSFFPEQYYEGTARISSNHMNGTIRFLENTDGSLNPDTASVKRAYALFQESDRSDRTILLGLDLAQIDPAQYQLGNAHYNPIMTADTLSYSNYPELRTAQYFALNKNYPILYYGSGNTLYEYQIEQRSNRLVLEYPSGETISYVHFLPCTYDDYTFRNLIVATTTTDGHYKIYRYTITGSQYTQVGAPYEGEGKVKTMLFASPNTYSYYGGGWSDELYRYY